jgi:hypothetical protein
MHRESVEIFQSTGQTSKTDLAGKDQGKSFLKSTIRAA